MDMKTIKTNKSFLLTRL